jgi:hypothetical protein
LVFLGGFMVRVVRCCQLLLLAFVLSCASKQAQAPATLPPSPPTHPWAWLQKDSSFLGQVVLEPFRGTPLWALWVNARKDQPAFGTLIDPEKIQSVVFGGEGHGARTPSVVAALTGPFGEGAVASAALQQQLAGERQGLLTVYRVGDVAVAQINANLIVMSSSDRVEWLASRTSPTVAIEVHESALYSSLAARVALDSADFAMLAEDRSGEAKAMAEQQAQRYGVAISAAALLRAGVSVDMGQPTQLKAAVETTGASQAQALQLTTANTLASLSTNMFVGLLGLRPLVAALAATQDGNHVLVAGNVQQEDFNRVLERLAGMLSVAIAQRTSSTP